MSDTRFNILIADNVVEICSNFDCIHEFCADYITEKPADFTVKISRDDITYEREREDNSKGSKGGRIPEDYPDSYLEVLACYRKISEEMLKRDILLMHGSSLSIDGKGVMFVAESGTGKSTHSVIWKNCFKDRVKLINDDKPLIKITDDGIYVCGTPWSGKKGLNSPVNAPLNTIYKIERAGDGAFYDSDADSCIVRKGKNVVLDLTYDEKWKIMVSQSYKSKDPAMQGHTMTLIDKIISNVSIKKIVCDMSDDAALAAYEGVFCGNIP